MSEFGQSDKPEWWARLPNGVSNEQFENPEYQEFIKPFLEFLERSNKESDLGVSVIAATMLENILERSLKAYLLPFPATNKLFDGPNGPAGTFSAKILLCSSLGIIFPHEYSELNIVRKIRNKFAHDLTVTFSDQSVGDLCANLFFSIKSQGDKRTDALTQFKTAVIALTANLYSRPHHVRKDIHILKIWGTDKEIEISEELQK